MNAVDQTKAGVASGVLSMSRMVGGTFGVAAMGALIAGAGRAEARRAAARSCPPHARQTLADALGAGGARVPAAPVGDAVQEAFVYALDDGLRIAAAVALLGALLAWLLIADAPRGPGRGARGRAPGRRAPRPQAALAEVV